jgi:exodeoxyribonuclease-1
MSVTQLVAAWKYDPDKSKSRLPIKTLQYNRCPAVAPLSVLDDDSRERIGLDLGKLKDNEKLLATIDSWPKKILEALSVMDEIQDHKYASRFQDVDESLYDGFFPENDTKLMIKVHEASAEQLTDMKLDFEDSRLNELLPLYKARNFPDSLSDVELESWNSYRLAKLTNGESESRLAKFEAEISELTKNNNLSKKEAEIINQLKLYESSVIS